MTKSPAFQFYPDDFLGSPKVRAMTTEEIGAYLLLLCLDWNGNGFEYDEEELARACNLSVERFRTAWKRISRCFVEKKSRLYNPRLEAERRKQREWRRKSSRGGKLSAQRRLKGGSRVVEPPGQPNANTPSPSPSPVTTTTKPSRAAARAGGQESWLLPVSRSYEALKGPGTFRFPKHGKLLKPLHQAGHSGEEIATRLTRYAKWLDDPKYFSLGKFSETFGDYADEEPATIRALKGYPDVVDATGVMTEYGERVTRPAGFKPFLVA
jgi:uncharacterized protein YdaU (DUF1376 family)